MVYGGNVIWSKCTWGGGGTMYDLMGGDIWMDNMGGLEGLINNIALSDKLGEGGE